MLSAGNMLLDILGIFVAFIAIFFTFFKWKYQYWRRKGVPYLESSIPFGDLSNPLNTKASFSDIMLEIYRKIRENGRKNGGMYILSRPVYVVTDLELAKHVLTKDFIHFVDRGTYADEKDDPLGCNLFALGGRKWRNLRTKLTPTFTPGKLKSMFQILLDCGVILDKYFQENLVNKQAVDIKDIFGRFTIDIIGSCAFGLECNTFNDQNSPFRVYAKKVFTFTKLQSLLFTVAMNLPNLGKLLGVRTVAKDISDFFMKVVEDTVTYREKNNYRRKDFLQLLIDMKNNRDTQENDGDTLTMDELAAQCFIFFVAGYETSSTTATFVLYELATHQDIQDKVRQEIKLVLEKHDNQVKYESLNELTYMKQVIDEALRKYPPLPLLTRVCVKDYKLPGEDLVLEKGTKVFIPIVGWHYDEEYYDNPFEFNPDRFTEENKRKRHPYAHIPFGKGPRACIGERFGIMQTKVGLTTILKNFKVTLNERTQTPIKLDIRSHITAAEGGIWLNIEKI